MNNLKIELLTVRANGGGLKELVALIHAQVGEKNPLGVLKDHCLLVNGKMIEPEDAQAYLLAHEGFGIVGMFTASDLPAAAHALEQIAEYELTGLDWEEPALAEASTKILAARALLLEASNLIDDVKNSL